MTALASITPQLVGNLEAEFCLLGALMQVNDLIDSVADKLQPQDFLEPLNGRIFAAIVRERSLGHNVSPVSLKPYFVDDPAINDVGGCGYLAGMTGQASFGAHDLADQILELSQRRKLIDGLGQAIAAAKDFDISMEELAVGIETALSEAMADEGVQTAIGAGDAVAEFVEALSEPDNGVISGIIPSLDQILGKLRPADLCIVAGRPGMGKTTLGQSYTLGAAQGGHGVLFVSLEMHKRQLAAKFACDYLSDDNRERVPFDSIVKRSLAANQRVSLARAADQIRDLPIVIEDLPGVTIGRLARIVRRHARRFAAKGTSLDLVVIDYLQLLDADDSRLDIRSAVTKISRGLKSIAKANNVAVMALSQLNRKVEERADKRPRTADLRESGQIEQDADQILFLLRREKYMREEEPDVDTADWHTWRGELDKQAGRIEFIVAKNRHGVEGSATGIWNGAFQAVRG
jgi:replicative DNA helicase